MLSIEILVAIIACASGIAAGAGKMWSRFGMLLYAILSMALALFRHLPDGRVHPEQFPIRITACGHTIQAIVVIKAMDRRISVSAGDLLHVHSADD